MNSDAPGVREITLTAGEARLSGLVAEPAGEPRAVVLALHGGGMRAAYFHGSAHPSLSLLTLGAALGFTVLALDRPGYGLSRLAVPQGAELDAQADALWLALDSFTATHPTGAGPFLLAHSYGSKVALRMAGHRRGTELLGLDSSGLGLVFGPAFSGGREELDDEREMYWGPPTTYPAGTADRGGAPLAGLPIVERRAAPNWPELFPAAAAGVRVPIRYTLAEHERIWANDEDALARTRALFTASPRVEVRVQPDAGHNISLSWAARGYHLGALAFAEECVLARTLP